MVPTKLADPHPLAKTLIDLAAEKRTEGNRGWERRHMAGENYATLKVRIAAMADTRSSINGAGSEPHIVSQVRFAALR